MTRPMRKAFFCQPAAGKLYVDDVFSAYTYTGNGSTQTINNGIDLAGKGGLVWVKSRSSALNHAMFDTSRGSTQMLQSDNTGAQAPQSNSITSFGSSGFSTGSNVYTNSSGDSYASWTFRKAPKFFDVVTWTGNGSNPGSQTIAHSLGLAPGMIICKKTSAANNWFTFHRSLNAKTDYLFLNATNAAATAAVQMWDSSANDFTVYSGAGLNDAGSTYVAYIFAHDTSADGMIQCGSFTASAGAASINIGWEPQYVMRKKTSGTSNWVITDSSRGMTTDGSADQLYADSSSSGGASVGPRINATGFTFTSAELGTGENGTFIYMAIRRPNKPPTSGTQVYNAIARTGTGAAANVTGVGFAPDALIALGRNTGTTTAFADKLRGASNVLRGQTTGAEFSDTGQTTNFLMDGVSFGSDSAWGYVNNPSTNYINYLFRRAPGFFDEVCYTGTGIVRAVSHNLGVVPELIIVKSRSAAGLGWYVYVASQGQAFGRLETTAQFFADTTLWNNTSPTSSVFSVGASNGTNQSSQTYVAYLFASCPGISKVGSYAGNGASQTINCGFATGARFVLIKRTDAAGDWYVWDSVRGIVAANDPHLSLNTAGAEVTTDDSVDPDASGFIVNQVAATNINVSGASYIFLAIV